MLKMIFNSNKYILTYKHTHTEKYALNTKVKHKIRNKENMQILFAPKQNNVAILIFSWDTQQHLIFLRVYKGARQKEFPSDKFPTQHPGHGKSPFIFFFFISTEDNETENNIKNDDGSINTRNNRIDQK